MTILMIRHGKPTTRFNKWCTWREFDEWLNTFNGGGVEEPSEILNALLVQVREIDIAFTSTLARSQHSALVLGLRSCSVNELFDEAEIPIVPIPIIKLPASIWVVLCRISWLFGFKNGTESFRAAQKRGRKAAEVLMQAAAPNRMVLLVGHGWMIRFIEKELIRTGWKKINRTGRNYWDSVEYKIGLM